ncbi:hypothetical protein CR969_01620 [Candidatus Saccharibacteria bacterium]|nr:MAG: hypothetical protein CR969_01620 [Candidatus Saccharibacteria bacterium]
MKKTIKSTLKLITKDRWMFWLLVINLIVAIVVIISIGVGIQPRETQVITQYTSYGVTGFYRGYWYWLWMYALLELIILVGHSLLAIKLLKDRPEIAKALMAITIGISILVLIFAKSISAIAALG